MRAGSAIAGNLGAEDGGWEYPAFLAAVTGVQALLGDGAYALRPSPSIARLSTETA